LAKSNLKKSHPPEAPAIKPARRPKRKKRAKRQPAAKPLPAPLPFFPNGKPDQPANVQGSVAESPSFSIGTEPKPGEPLNADAERILAAVPEKIDAETGEDAAEPPFGESESADILSDLMPKIDFDSREVQDVLEEAFDWMAERFDSAHWKLTERQSRMLGKPTAQLLGSLYAKLSNYLPEILSRWCDSTPGAMAFILASAVVVAPKVAQQVVVSRERRKNFTSRKSASPIPIRPPSQAGPVGPMPTSGPIEDQ
jgi:hypothetical protein